MTKYLREHPAPDLHHRTFLLWASLKLDHLMTPEERETTSDLLSLQREDGGWSLPTWATGAPGRVAEPEGRAERRVCDGPVVYVLRQAGVPSEDPAIRRGVAWLEGNQRESGRWFTRSLNNDKAHYIANAGTGFAVMALAACR